LIYFIFCDWQLIKFLIAECTDLSREFDCQPNNVRSCIDKHFMNDTIVNCAEPYCLDEQASGCASSSVYVTDSFEDGASSENIIQIFLSAITSLILTMLSCGAIIWIIYKIKKCISPPSQSAVRQQQHRRRRRNNTEVVSTSQDSASPTAPPMDDKDDMPPSYSDLFPEQAAARKNDAENT
jgi:hypothetical protein